LIYFGAAKLGLSMAFFHASASPVWPPTGIALAAVIIFGYRVWPGILIGAFVANATTDIAIATAGAIALGNTLEALVGGWLVNRFAGGSTTFVRPATVLAFVGLAAVLATAISATIGVMSLAVAGSAAWGHVASIWLTWWLGDMAGALIVAPLIVVWSRRPRSPFAAARFAEAAGLVAVVVIVATTVFSDWPFAGYPLGFLCIPPLVWAAYRFGLHGAVVAAVIMDALSIWGTMRGQGPFAVEDRNQSLLLLQAFMATVAMTSLLLAAAVSDQARVQAELAHHRDHLQDLVHQRTAELKSSHEQLRLAERMSALGTLAAGLGHDMANLLLPLRVRFEALQRNAIGEAGNADIGVIATALDYLQKLAGGLRLLAVNPERPHHGVPTELGDWWSEVEPVFRAVLPRGIALRSQLPDQETWVAMSRPALTQMVFNLVQNAGDAMRSRGAGTVTVSAECCRNDALVRLGVSDNGPGMAPEVKKSCMEPFFTTKPRGLSTGLGLSFVYGLVREAGGSIEVESEPGAGTTFRINIPRAAASRHADCAKLAIVDLSNERMRSFVATQLRALSFEVKVGTLSEHGIDGASLLVLDGAKLAATSLGEMSGQQPRIVAFGDPGCVAAMDALILETQPKVKAIREALRQCARAM
jgi:signal transduction histidine kinase